MATIRTAGLALALMLMLGGLRLLGQEQLNAAKINILSPAAGCLNLQYERSVSPQFSLQLGSFYQYGCLFEQKSSKKSIGITPEFRYYLEKMGLQGILIAPYLRLICTTETISYYESNETEERPYEMAYSEIGGGIVIGHKWVYAKHFGVEVFCGPQLLDRLSGREESTIVSEGFYPNIYDRMSMRFGVNAGYVF